MATLNLSKSGRIAYLNGGTHSTARNAATGNSISVNPTFSTANGIQYSVVSGRRGNTYSIYRVFYYFDTSGITGTVSAASLNITGYTATTADVIVVPSTAFSGDGSTDVVFGDYSNLSFNTNYSDEHTGWSTGLNTITLKSQARTDIQNNNYFICAVIQYDNDYSNTDPGTISTYQAGIAFGTTAYLDYTESTPSGPTNVSSFAGVAKANISKLSAVTFGDISKINGVE